MQREEPQGAARLPPAGRMGKGRALRPMGPQSHTQACSAPHIQEDDGLVNGVVPGVQWLPTLECSLPQGQSPGRMGTGTPWRSWGPEKGPPPPEKVWARGAVVKPAISRSPWGRTGGSSLCVVRAQPHSPVLSSISPGRSTPKIFFRGKCSLTGTQKAENYIVQIGSGLTAQTHSRWCVRGTDSSPSGRALSSGLPGTAGVGRGTGRWRGF